MLVTATIVLFLIVMLASLGLGMVFLLRDRGRGTRTVRALTWRIGIWAVLFALLVGGMYSGVITPGGSLLGGGAATTHTQK